MGIENIHILQPQAFQALVEGGQHVFPASPVPIGAGPHAVARFGGDNQLVPIRGQIGFQHPSQGFFRRAGNRAVVVGRVDMGHAQIEGPQQNRPGGLIGRHAAEILPDAQGHRRQLEAAATHPAVGHVVIAAGVGTVRHFYHPFLEQGILCTVLYRGKRGKYRTISRFFLKFCAKMRSRSLKLLRQYAILIPIQATAAKVEVQHGLI